MSLKVRILGADSIGVRSMATIVEVEDYKILIDPGVSFAPRRYGLPPHPLELERLEDVRESIRKELEDSDIVIITHYHYDHYLYREEDVDLYKGKILLVKNPRDNINVSQRLRAHRFLVKNRVAELAKRVMYIDSNWIQVGDSIVIRGSPPMPHGSDGTRLGYVIIVSVEHHGYMFMHASDVQGPMSGRALEWILQHRPTILLISGPPTYFAGYKVSEEEVTQGLRNLETITQRLDATVIVDHHMARDLKYLEYLEKLRRQAKGRVVSAFEYMGVPYEPLEALRKQLWEEKPPDSDRALRG